MEDPLAALGERCAHGEDIPRVMELIRSVISHLREQGIDQWDTAYPDEATIRQDVAAGQTRVLAKGSSVVAYVVVNPCGAPEYAAVSWRGTRALIVHRLMVHPAWEGNGIARRLMTWAERVASDSGHDSVRLDAFLGNPRAIDFYARLGYVRSGTVAFRKGLFAALEKLLPEASRS